MLSHFQRRRAPPPPPLSASHLLFALKFHVKIEARSEAPTPPSDDKFRGRGAGRHEERLKAFQAIAETIQLPCLSK